MTLHPGLELVPRADNECHCFPDILLHESGHIMLCESIRTKVPLPY